MLHEIYVTRKTKGTAHTIVNMLIHSCYRPNVQFRAINRSIVSTV